MSVASDSDGAPQMPERAFEMNEADGFALAPSAIAVDLIPNSVRMMRAIQPRM